MDRHDLEAVLAQRLQHRRHFFGEHRDVAGNGRVLVAADKRGPGIEAHACVDRCAHLDELQIRAADGDFVDRAVLLARRADDPGERRHVQRGGRRGGRRWRRGGAADQRQRRLDVGGEIRRRAVPVHVHVEDARLLPEKMIVQRRHVEAGVEQCRHHRVDLVLREHQVAHHDVHPAGAFGHRQPAAEAERCRRLDAGDGDREIAARNVDLEHAVLEIPLFAERGQDLLILGRHVRRLDPRDQRIDMARDGVARRRVAVAHFRHVAPVLGLTGCGRVRRQRAPDGEDVRRGGDVAGADRRWFLDRQDEAVLAQSLQRRGGQFRLRAGAAINRALAKAALGGNLVEVGGGDHALGRPVLAHEHDGRVALRQERPAQKRGAQEHRRRPQSESHPAHHCSPPHPVYLPMDHGANSGQVLNAAVARAGAVPV